MKSQRFLKHPSAEHAKRMMQLESVKNRIGCQYVTPVLKK